MGVNTYLCVLELLLDIPDDSLARPALERTVDELGPDFARPGDSPRDARELANLVSPKVADALDEGQVVERERERADREAGRGSRVGVRVGVEIVGDVLLYEILKGAAEVREEAVVLVGNSLGEEVARGDQVLVVDVERRKLELGQAADLVDVEVSSLSDVHVRGWVA